MRPKLWHHIVTGLSGLSLLGVTVYTVIRYGSLPEKIPTHFDGAGLADGFGHKSGLVMLLFLSWMMFGMLTVVSFFPDAWNVPKRSPRTLAAAADMLAVMKLVTTLMFCWLVLCSVQGWNLGGWFLPVTMAGLFAPLVHLLIAAARK
jgi:Predicted membrane protein